MAERPAYKQGSAISHVARNNRAGELRAAKMAQGCVYGMNQIQARINQGAIEIKHQQSEALRIKGAQETNHGQNRIPQPSGKADLDRGVGGMLDVRARKPLDCRGAG
jgi:hypothetical protein